MANKVFYGLEKAHYAILNPTDGTFGTPVPLKGAVTLTISPEGNSGNFFADNSPYVTFTTNSGYTGSIELATLEAEAAAALLGETIDANGGVYEDASASPAQFALLYEIEGNVNPQRFALYNCTVSRPERTANTTTDSTDPDTTTLNFTAIPLEMTVGGETKKVTKYALEKSSENTTVYNGFFTAVVKPSAAA